MFKGQVVGAMMHASRLVAQTAQPFLSRRETTVALLMQAAGLTQRPVMTTAIRRSLTRGSTPGTLGLMPRTSWQTLVWTMTQGMRPRATKPTPVTVAATLTTAATAQVPRRTKAQVSRRTKVRAARPTKALAARPTKVRAQHPSHRKRMSPAALSRTPGRTRLTTLPRHSREILIPRVIPAHATSGMRGVCQNRQRCGFRILLNLLKNPIPVPS